jgi:hypothetical protein
MKITHNDEKIAVSDNILHVTSRTDGYSSGGRRGFERAARKVDSTSTMEWGEQGGNSVLSSRASLIRATWKDNDADGV